LASPSRFRETWPPDREARLKALVAANELSYNQMATELGVTRAAVIGKAHRLGLAKKPVYYGKLGKPRKRTSQRPYKARAPRQPRPVVGAIVEPATVPHPTRKRPHEARLTSVQLYAMLRQAVENTAAHTPEAE
jgi:hypothetical protein